MLIYKIILKFGKYFVLRRRGVREAEGARLESVCMGNRTVGSNPTLSANCKTLLDTIS